jgi:hypothetical protein
MRSLSVNIGAGGVSRMFAGTGGPLFAPTATSAGLAIRNTAKTASKAKATRVVVVVVVVFLICLSYRLLFVLYRDGIASG